MSTEKNLARVWVEHNGWAGQKICEVLKQGYKYTHLMECGTKRKFKIKKELVDSHVEFLNEKSETVSEDK